MENYVARASGSVGQEILNPDGEVIAWTVDGWWAAAIVDLLNRAEKGDRPSPRAEKPDRPTVDTRNEKSPGRFADQCRG